MRYYFLACVISLSLLGCSLGSVPYKHGDETLLKWDQEKLQQSFPLGQTLLTDVQQIFGPCHYRKLSDDENASREAMNRGMSMICTYRYVAGKLTNCGDSSCYVGLGTNEYEEISVDFTFDELGMLKTVNYNKKKEDTKEPVSKIESEQSKWEQEQKD